MTEQVSPTSYLLPGWDVLRRDYIESGVPGRVVVRRDSMVELFVDQGGSRIGGLFELPVRSTVPTSPFTDIELAEIWVEERRCLAISTTTTALFATFYLLLVDMARAVIERSTHPTEALQQSLANWRALLQTAALLTEDRQLGLAGELWLLERLVQSLGAVGLDAWVGPDAQAHDFRLGKVEFEVKSTGGSRRLHWINGLQQLAPTVGAQLYLLSIRFAAGGASGETLGETVERIREMLTPKDRLRLVEKLEAIGYRMDDATQYSRRRRLADQPRLIEIQDGVPRLTTDAMAALPARFGPMAISDVRYCIDVEGMGIEEGTPAFSTVLTL